MIEKINALSSCHNRLHSTGLKTKSRIGHRFKYEVLQAIYGMEGCTFSPETNEKKANKRKYKVFSNAERLFNDNKLYKEKREKQIEEMESKLFHPEITSYHYKDVWRKPKQGERLGLTPRSLHTKYYRPMDFSPYRFKKNMARIAQNMEDKNISLMELTNQNLSPMIRNIDLPEYSIVTQNEEFLRNFNLDVKFDSEGVESSRKKSSGRGLRTLLPSEKSSALKRPNGNLRPKSAMVKKKRAKKGGKSKFRERHNADLKIDMTKVINGAGADQELISALTNPHMRFEDLVQSTSRMHIMKTNMSKKMQKEQKESQRKHEQEIELEIMRKKLGNLKKKRHQKTKRGGKKGRTSRRRGAGGGKIRSRTGSKASGGVRGRATSNGFSFSMKKTKKGISLQERMKKARRSQIRQEMAKLGIKTFESDKKSKGSSRSPALTVNNENGDQSFVGNISPPKKENNRTPSHRGKRRRASSRRSNSSRNVKTTRVKNRPRPNQLTLDIPQDFPKSPQKQKGVSSNAESSEGASKLTTSLYEFDYDIYINTVNMDRETDFFMSILADNVDHNEYDRQKEVVERRKKEKETLRLARNKRRIQRNSELAQLIGGGYGMEDTKVRMRLSSGSWSARFNPQKVSQIRGEKTKKKKAPFRN